ncbi:type VI secretion system-associated protein TagF [Novosphingobium sp.]|uniref:type VI secretion system-associated protein TagF n=1 Tax=Novosphingobium sp. TaxID=1874826 RepID=UPI003B515F50
MSDRPLGRWLFGKLPSHGDFVSRGLSHDLRDAFDVWLSAELRDAQDLFGAAFDDRYFAAPAWMFVDCDGAGRWSGGALCASVDAVGRMFPVIAGAPANDAHDAAIAAAASIELLFATFSNTWSADQMIAAQAEATGGPPPAPWQTERAAWALIGESGPPIVMPGRYPRGVIARMIEVAA